ncbi:MAG: hypothetical protein AAF614_00780 [Chloroflexota bacterium]
MSKTSVANNRVELRTLLVSALGTSLAAWEIAFNFAIHGTVFYDKLMAVWVIATVILLAMLLSGQRSVLGRWGIVMLLLPTGWFIFFALSPTFATASYAGLFWTAAIVIFIAAIGYILSILAWLLDNDGIMLSSAYRNRLATIVLFVAIIGYLVGTYHQNFVTCTQFQIAGDSVPTDCASSEFWE